MKNCFKAIMITRMVLLNDCNSSQSFHLSEINVGGSLHPCYRTCVAGEVQTCVYSFTLAEYTTMSNPCGDCPFTESDCYATGCITAGGDVRSAILVNHMLPGPSIQVNITSRTIIIKRLSRCLNRNSDCHFLKQLEKI